METFKKRNDYAPSCISGGYLVKPLSTAQKIKQRFEIMLLSNPEGLMVSHAKKALSCNDEALCTVIAELELINIHGYLVHPHFADCIVYGELFPSSERIRQDDSEVDSDFINILLANPVMSIYTALKKANVKNPHHLIAYLRHWIGTGIDVNKQYCAVYFLNHRFNYNLRVCY